MFVNENHVSIKGHNSGKTFQSTPKENVFGNFHVVVIIILVKKKILTAE